MACPYDLYIRFLITGNCESVEEVNRRLEDLDLPPVTRASFDAQYSAVHDNIPGGIAKQIISKNYSSDFLQWMKILEVQDLWFADDIFKKKYADDARRARLVVDINQDPQLRLAINALLIKGVPHDDILRSVNVRFSTLLKEAHISIYSRFFMNPSRMTRKSWKSFLSRCGGSEKHIYFLALSDTLDVLKTELELPAKVVVSDTIQYLLTQSFQKAKLYLKTSTKESNAEARAWIDQVSKLVDKYEKYRSGDTDDFLNNLQMEFDFVENEFPVPDEKTLNELGAKIKQREEMSTNQDDEKEDNA